MNHTPGPWEVRIWDGEDWPEKRISIGSAGDAVCISPRYKFNIEDFNLIAAAPDLLEALESVVEALSNFDEEGLIEYAQQIIDARAAIAKARGES